MNDSMPELRALDTAPRSDLLDRYTALSAQQSTYRRRASSTPPRRPSSSSSSSSPSPTTSPSTHASPTSSSPPTFSLSSSPDPDTTDHALYEVNHAIKSTLTDLLNCEAVKCDGKWRSWCQARLMDAELELKRQRRRRVSSGVGGTESVEDGEGRRESW